MNNHSFDDIVRQKASGHESPVLPGTWEAIERKKQKRKRIIFFWWTTCIVLLSGAGVLYLYNNYHSPKNAVTLVERKTDDVTKESIIARSDSAHEITDGRIKKPTTKEPGVDNGTLNTNNRIPASDNTISKDSLFAVPGIIYEKPAQVEHSPAVTMQAKAAKKSFRQTQVAGKTGSGIYQEPASNKNFSGLTGTPTGELITPVVPINKYFSNNYRVHDKIATYNKTEKLQLAAGPFDKNFADVFIKKNNEVMAAVQATSTSSRLLRKSKWSVEIALTPMLPIQQNQSFQYLLRTNTEGMQRSEYKTNRVKTRLQPSMTYTVAIAKKITPRLQLAAGIQYAMIKEKVNLEGKEIRTTYTEVQRLVTGSNGPELVKDTVASTSSGMLTIDALNSYRFVSVPLFIQYKLMENRSWLLQVNGGVYMNIAASYHNSIRGKLVRIDNNGAHINGQGNNIAFDLFTGFRISRKYQEFRFFAEPVLRYNASRYDPGNMINGKFMHKAGLSLGVAYELH